MNTITVIKETLLPILPEDIIRNITSFLIMKIPKNDYRYKMLEEYLFYNRSYRIQHLFWSTKEYRGFIFKFYNQNHILIMDWIPNTFIEYSFQNITKKESTNDRYLFDKKCWVKYYNDCWNINTFGSIRLH